MRKQSKEEGVMLQYKDIVQMAFEERKTIDAATEQVLNLCGGVHLRSDLPAVPIVENGDGSASTPSGSLFQK